MSILRRKPSSETDPAVLLLQGHDMIAQVGLAHAERWGLGSSRRWRLDGTAGTLVWEFADYSATASVQVLGSHSAEASSWRWGWANESLPDHLRTTSARVRTWGRAHGVASLTTPELGNVGVEQAADLAALAFRVAGATGFYRTSGSSPTLFLTFGAVRVQRAGGAEEVFEISVS